MSPSEDVSSATEIRIHLHTMYLQMMPSSRLAAGHSGQNKTTSRSDIRLSKIVRYSASFEFLVALPLPDLYILEFSRLIL